MSAFLQTDYHIATLAYWIERYCGTAYSAEQIGQILLDENVRSLVARYGEGDAKQAHTIDMGKIYYDANPDELIKMARGYAYQACESDDWKTTEAHGLIESLQEHLLGIISESVDHRFWALN